MAPLRLCYVDSLWTVSVVSIGRAQAQAQEEEADANGLYGCKTRMVIQTLLPRQRLIYLPELIVP